jgi:type IV secretory pathway TraG/TraD family ATPase VirD4
LGADRRLARAILALPEETSHSLLVGAILHILFAEEVKTLARVATCLSDPERPFGATSKAMMTANRLGAAEAPEVHPGRHARKSVFPTSSRAASAFSFSATRCQFVPYRSLPSLLPFDFEQEERGLLSI